MMELSGVKRSGLAAEPPLLLSTLLPKKHPQATAALLLRSRRQQCLPQIKVTLIKRAADDGADDACVSL